MNLIDATKSKSKSTKSSSTSSYSPALQSALNDAAAGKFGSSMQQSVIKNVPSLAPATKSTGSTQVQGVSYSKSPYPYSRQQSPIPANQSSIGQYSPIPYMTLPGGGASGASGGTSVTQNKPVLTPYGDKTVSMETAAQLSKLLSDLKKVDGSPKIAVDNGTSRDDEKKMKEEIAYKSNRGPLDMSYLTEAEKYAKEAWKDKEMTANAMYDRVRSGTEEQQRLETGTTSTALARAGGYLGFSSSGESKMISLERSHRAEILEIESRRTQALAEARTAYNEQLYGIAQEKQKLADEYEKQQYEEKQKYFDEVKNIQKQEKANADIYDAIQSGAKDEMEVFGKLKDKATPEQIKNFFDTFKPKTTNSDLFKPSTSDTAMLVGAGFNSDDIQAIYDRLNEFGYDDVLKASLTPYQRRVLDDMLTMKPEKEAASTSTSTSKNAITLSPSQRAKLAGVNMTPVDINAFLNDVNEYGIETAIKGIDNQEQIDVINELFGSDIQLGETYNAGESNEDDILDPVKLQERWTDELRRNKDKLTRDEAYERAIKATEEQSGGELTRAQEIAIDKAIREVYGESWLENILPGGRGNFPFTPDE